jgi:hypothetical protein
MISSAAAKYFWDVDPKSLDIQKHERLIISRLINYGTLDDWRWLASTYGKERIARALHARGRTSIRTEARYLAEIVFE